MSEETQESQETLEQVTEAAKEDDTQTTDPEPTAANPAPDVEDQTKSVKFDSNELTFDEAQAEIDAIKERADKAKESLKFVPAATDSSISSSSYSSYRPSSTTYENETPKSKNMLSHLNSNSAMMNYKVTTARNLVQQQEALLRNLKMMRENMERSSVEIGQASTYLPARAPQRGYFEKRAETAPIISRRAVREVSSVISPYSNLELTEHTSERAYSPARISTSSYLSTLPPPVSTADYQPDEEFEKEMAALRKRVADLSKKATEPPMPRFSSYDYGSTLLDNSLGEYTDTCDVPLAEPKIEVKKVKTHKVAPQTHHTKLPPKMVYTSKHVPIDNDVCSYPVNSYTDYLLETVNNLEPCTNNSSSLDLQELYADPLANPISDYPSAY